MGVNIDMYIFIYMALFKYTISYSASFFRYIEDILLIYPQDLDLYSITDSQNKVKPCIKFTCVLESNNTLPFLDVLLIRNNDKLKFSVYCKPFRRNNHIHFYLTPH